jgi:hypothetical protein
MGKKFFWLMMSRMSLKPCSDSYGIVLQRFSGGHLCQQEQSPHDWQYEIAAVMSQIGCITLPPAILRKLYAGVELSPEVRQMYEQHPDVLFFWAEAFCPLTR